MTKEEAAKVYVDFLTEEGYRPKIDSDGDVGFKFEGGWYCLLVNEDDPEYFNLAFPAFWPIEDEQERFRALEAANAVGATTKFVKLWVSKDGKDVWAHVQSILSNPKELNRVFDRAIGALSYGVKKFQKEMAKTKPAEPATTEITTPKL